MNCRSTTGMVYKKMLNLEIRVKLPDAVHKFARPLRSSHFSSVCLVCCLVLWLMLCGLLEVESVWSCSIKRLVPLGKVYIRWNEPVSLFPACILEHFISVVMAKGLVPLRSVPLEEGILSCRRMWRVSVILCHHEAGVGGRESGSGGGGAGLTGTAQIQMVFSQ
jgi:hypothetical protein